MWAQFVHALFKSIDKSVTLYFFWISKEYGYWLGGVLTQALTSALEAVRALPQLSISILWDISLLRLQLSIQYSIAINNDFVDDVLPELSHSWKCSMNNLLNCPANNDPWFHMFCKFNSRVSVHEFHQIMWTNLVCRHVFTVKSRVFKGVPVLTQYDLCQTRSKLVTTGRTRVFMWIHLKIRTGGAVPIMNQYDMCQLVQKWLLVCWVHVLILTCSNEMSRMSANLILRKHCINMQRWISTILTFCHHLFCQLAMLISRLYYYSVHFIAFLDTLRNIACLNFVKQNR